MSQAVPMNIEAEQQLLGCFVVDGELMSVLTESYSVKFYDKRNMHIFIAMHQLVASDTNIDCITLAHQLNKRGMLVAAGGEEYIRHIVELEYSAVSFPEYRAIVDEMYVRRQIIAAGEAIVKRGFEMQLSCEEYLDFAERSIYDVAKNRKAEGLTHIISPLEVVSERLYHNMNNTSNITGLASGFPSLDKITLGFQPDNLVIIASRPGMGKSALLTNLAINICRTNPGRPRIAIFSLEMSKEQNVQRMLACQGNVSLMRIQNGKVTPDEKNYFEIAKEELRRYNIYFCDRGTITPQEIRAICRNQQQSDGLDLVIVDYLQLVKGATENERKQRHEEVGFVSRTLKQMARDLHIPVIAAAQVSRDVDKEKEKRPQLAHLKESGSIEQDADIVMFLHREGYYKKDEPALANKAEIIIAKNRSGESGKTVQVLFEGEYSRFKEWFRDDN